jgi:hypothetical protein
MPEPLDASVPLDDATPALMPTDRCDQCSSEAQLWVVLEAKSLMFCGHHGRRHELALLASGWAFMVDKRSKMTEDH